MFATFGGLLDVVVAAANGAVLVDASMNDSGACGLCITKIAHSGYSNRTSVLVSNLCDFSVGVVISDYRDIRT